ncbi:hypothetical protein N9954_06055 [Maribacter sp.]|nr:hypothetical protein [Maribacter sp.]
MKISFKNAFSLLSLLIPINTVVMAQVASTSNPVFEIIKMQDGAESGDEVIYMVKLTDGAGRPLVNTTNEDFHLAIEFGVDSDAERSDMAMAFPTTIAIQKGTGSTVIRLKVHDDLIHENTENLVAMIYDPSIGTISETLSYATATISDDDPITVSDTTYALLNTGNNTKTEERRNPVITMLQK